jgi:hypothetical protein
MSCAFPVFPGWAPSRPSATLSVRPVGQPLPDRGAKSSLRQKWFRVRMAPAVCAALAVLAYPGYFMQPTIAQEGMRGRSEAGDIECISYCSTTRPGTVLMEVRVRLADHQLNEADLRSRVRQQGLEVTVYSDGFERGLYATVSAIKPKALFRARLRAGSAAAAQIKIPGLEKLLITDVATRSDKAAQSLLLMQPPTQTADEGEWVRVRLEGLDPGMAYTFRVPGGQSVVTRQAAFCPVDGVPAPTNRVKRKS